MTTQEELMRLAITEPVGKFLKTELLAVSDGYAKVSMRVTGEHINFNGMVFGGIIMCLADQAFAYASNSIIRPNIAVQFNIHFLSAPRVGDSLIAEGRVVKQGKHSGTTEITITSQSGVLIAKATGTTIATGQSATRDGVSSQSYGESGSQQDGAGA